MLVELSTTIVMPVWYKPHAGQRGYILNLTLYSAMVFEGVLGRWAKDEEPDREGCPLTISRRKTFPGYFLCSLGLPGHQRPDITPRPRLHTRGLSGPVFLLCT